MKATTLRKLGVVFAAIALLVLLVPLVLNARGEARLEAAVERFESEVGPLDLLSYQPPALERPENASAWLLAGTEALILSKSDRQLMTDLRDRSAAEWSPAERSRLRQALASVEPAFSLMERAVELPRGHLELDYSAGHAMEIPDHLAILSAQRVVELRGRLALAEGDLETYRRASLTLGRAAALMEGETILLSQLIGMALEQGFLRLVQDGLAAGLAEPQILDELRRSVGTEDLDAMLRRSLGGEGSMWTAVTMDTAKEMLRNTHGDGIDLSLLIPGSLQPAAAAVLDYYRAVAQNLERPFAEVHGELGGAAPPIEASGPTGRLAHQFAANFDLSVNRAKALGAARQLADAALRIRAEGLASGAYPDALPEAEPSPYTGEVPIYELRPNGSVRLQAAGAAELYSSTVERNAHRMVPLFDWELPAPPTP